MGQHTGGWQPRDWTVTVILNEYKKIGSRIRKQLSFKSFILTFVIKAINIKLS